MATTDVFDLCSSDEDEDRKPASRTYSQAPKTRPVTTLVTRDERRAGRHVDNDVIVLDDSSKARNSVDTILSEKKVQASRVRPRSATSSVIDLTSSAPQNNLRCAALPLDRKKGENLVANSHTPATSKHAKAPHQRTLVSRVWEVFPDVDKAYAEKKLRDCGNKIDMVLSILSDGNYKRRKLGITDVKIAPSLSVLVKRSKVQPKYDYMSPSSFEVSLTYVEETTKQLLHEFPFFTTQGIKAMIKKSKNHYSIARQKIFDLLKGIDRGIKQLDDDKIIEQYHELRSVWISKKPSAAQLERIGRTLCCKRLGGKRDAPVVTDPVLRGEIEWNRERLEDWMAMIETKIQRRRARMHSNSKVQCSCCFETVPIEEMVACRGDGHLFCADCIESYTKTAVFSNGSLGTNTKTGKMATELLCCDASGCQAGFDAKQLEKALQSKTLEKYNELLFLANCELAGLQNSLCTCPQCGFKADLPANLIIFECPMEDCRHKSCRKCGKAPHIPLRCEEVLQQNREDEGRLRVEEAMASAKIRTCPKCKTSFVKSDGCNKMTCRCGVKICYICRVQLKGSNPYTHFCQKPHCDHKQCNRCTLYSNAEEDDIRAMREAGQTAAKTYQKELLQEDKDASIHIDVDKIIHRGVPNKRRRPFP